MNPADISENNAPVSTARLYGQPLLEIPSDLYIPPDALEVFLEAFEGPLDLLLYLIRKSNLDILDIQMAPLTHQYLSYVESMRRHNLELAADYLLMAASLLEIKSRMLLPRPNQQGDGEQEEDPRAELVRRLLEYEQMKKAAFTLDELPRALRDFEWVGIKGCQQQAKAPAQVSLHDLQQAWLQIAKRSDLNKMHQIQREELSVREHMTLVLRKIQSGKFMVFESLFAEDARPATLVVTFLAILELARERLIELAQNLPLAPIYVRLKCVANET